MSNAEQAQGTEDVQEAEPGESNVEALPVARPAIVVTDEIPVLDTGRFEQMQRIASAMASSSLIPKHLLNEEPRISQANCFLVVNQAVRWRMDPFALAQHAFVVHGRLGYEGKVVAAVVNGSRQLARKLSYRYEGEGDKRKIVVSGTLRGEDQSREIDGTYGGWKTNNENWKKSPDQMLAYRGAREWARRHMPEAMLGVFSDDELMDMSEQRGMRDVTPPSPPPAPPPPADLKVPEQEVIPPKAPKAPRQRKAGATAYADKHKEQQEQVPDHDPETGEVHEEQPFDPDKWLDDLEAQMTTCTTDAMLEEVWSQAQSRIEGGEVFPPDVDKAEDAYKRHIARLEGEESAQ